MPESNPNRREFLQKMAATGGVAALYDAAESFRLLNEPHRLPVRVTRKKGRGQHVVVIGGGVAGLASAYELLRQDTAFQVTVLEASHRIGGRNFTVRNGDQIVEETAEHGRTVQTCVFDSEPDQPYEPYLNAGPGRINSSHINLLNYCRDLRIELEVYVMESASDVDEAKGRRLPRRHVTRDFCGWMAQQLYQWVDDVPDLNDRERDELREMLSSFGNLARKEGNIFNCFDDDVGPIGTYTTRGPGGKMVYSAAGLPTAGFKRLPTIEPGIPVDPLSLQEILATGIGKTGIFQPEQFDWQATLFQPVGGMDAIPRAFEQALRYLGATIRTSSPVTRIARHPGGGFELDCIQGSRTERIHCDHVISNMPMPLLEGVLEPGSVGPQFEQALQVVFDTENESEEGFLSSSSKVGWQGQRNTWQNAYAEDRVVPIFGGISFTTHPITQIWYPSSCREIYAESGILTGAYNFRENAKRYGAMLPEERLVDARAGARLLAGDDFADGLRNGVSIAWQNVPYLHGGWAQWESLSTFEGQSKCVDVYNTLTGGDRGSDDNWFLICGDQVSQLPGWQEGAVMSAIHAVNLLASDDYEAPTVDRTPISNYLVY